LATRVGFAINFEIATRVRTDMFRAKLARKTKARKARKRRAAEARRRYHPDRIRVVVDKREELYGKGEGEDGMDGYTEAQVAHVDAIVDGYTPEEFAAALAQANALDWEPEHSREDWHERRVEQRRQQGRGA
jgi:hypothetical protein